MKYTNPMEASPTEVFFNLVGGKYKVKCLPRVNPKTLTQQLRSMERDGLLVRTVYPEVPPRVEYSLTELGAEIFPLVREIHLWAVDYVRGLPKEKAPVTDRIRVCYRKEDA